MSRSLLAKQLPAEDWILLPAKDFPESRAGRNARRAHSRYIRHLLFDLGHGKFTNLSPENHRIVLDECRKHYELYVAKVRADGGIPMPFSNQRKGFIHWWKWRLKGDYVRMDIPKKLREFEKVA
jgi:hypothetical protein